MTSKTILALDLATTTGYAIGVPGQTPTSGSVAFGKNKLKPNHEVTHEEIAANCLTWAATIIKLWKPWMIVCEAPIPPNVMRGHTTLNTTLILMGLPFLIGGIAYKLGIKRVHTVPVSAVRTFFIGQNHKSAVAEKMTLENCQRLGWQPNDHNEADALALWLYQCSLIEPEIGTNTSPLFFQKIGRATTT